MSGTPSFCIITAGARPLDRVLAAIFAQAPAADVVVAGCPPTRPDITPVFAVDAARAGRLGALRNAAVAHARGDWIAILDDDIVLQAGYVAAFAARRTPSPIVTARVLLPDGTRYWDHATTGGASGHVLLKSTESDPHVYMTGGGGWVMHKSVRDVVLWDAQRGFYAEEDSDFARRCRSAGLVIKHEPRMVVLHDAPQYTSIGRTVLRRRAVASVQWVTALRDDPPEVLLARASLLEARGLLAEVADCLRAGCEWHPACEPLTLALARMQATQGGAIDGCAWHAGDASIDSTRAPGPSSQPARSAPV